MFLQKSLRAQILALLGGSLALILITLYRPNGLFGGSSK